MPNSDVNIFPSAIRALASGVVSMAAIGAAGSPLAVAAPGPTPRPLTMEADLAQRAAAIHWPAKFDPATADLFAHNELFIQASCERVWSHLVDAAKWPSWYPNAREVQLVEGGAKLEPNSVFTWTTFGLRIESKVHEFVPGSRLGWHGGAPGQAPAFFHSFYLRDEGAGCRVITEEVGIGPDASHLRQVDESLLHRGHALWLAALQWVAEGQ